MTPSWQDLHRLADAAGLTLTVYGADQLMGRVEVALARFAGGRVEWRLTLIGNRPASEERLRAAVAGAIGGGS